MIHASARMLALGPHTKLMLTPVPTTKVGAISLARKVQTKDMIRARDQRNELL